MAKPKRVSDEQFRTFLEWNMSDAEIGARTGHHPDYIAKRRRSLGVVLPPDERVIRGDLEAHLMALAEEGWPPEELAAEAGVSKYTILQHIPAGPNGQAYAAVKRWGRKVCPQLLDEIQGTEI